MLKKAHIDHLFYGHLSEGPEFLETFLSSRIRAEGHIMFDPLNKYLKYIDILNDTDIVREKKKDATKSFFLGHFYMENAEHVDIILYKRNGLVSIHGDLCSSCIGCFFVVVFSIITNPHLHFKIVDEYRTAQSTYG